MPIRNYRSQFISKGAPCPSPCKLLPFQVISTLKVTVSPKPVQNQGESSGSFGRISSPPLLLEFQRCLAIESWSNARRSRSSSRLFQFHTGSIESLKVLWAGDLVHVSFNSTLVRLRAGRDLHRYHQDAIVSIPHWFD